VLAQYVLFGLVQCARASWMGFAELVTEQAIETGAGEGLPAGAQRALDTTAFSAATKSHARGRRATQRAPGDGCHARHPVRGA
jgi:hypothetical protein